MSRQNSPSRSTIPPTTTTTTTGEPRPQHPLAQKPSYPADRPPTGQRQDTAQQMMRGMPGAMPGTPGGEAEYVMVEEQGRGR